jgi:hypothetical protein
LRRRSLNRKVVLLTSAPFPARCRALCTASTP